MLFGVCSCITEDMVTEKNIKDTSLDFINLDIPLNFLPLLTHTSYNNCSDFCLPLDKVGQFWDQCNQAMYEGEDALSQSQDFSVPSSKALKAELTCGSSTAPERTELCSRQSSLTEEWFGNISNAHPNDISVDSSLEALFASTDWPDLGVEMPSTTDAAVTDNCFTDPNVYQSVNCQVVSDTQNKETVACQSLAESLPFTTVCRNELQVAISDKAGECSSQRREGILYFFVVIIYYMHLV